MTTLQTVWFLLICVLWSGYFVLEGFDFGVGMLLRKLGRTATERRDLLHTFGPVWDGNEVWLLTAGGATFAAFPEWYATLFSGFYLPLFLVLLGLILRNVGVELWGKEDGAAWRSRWEWAIVVGSAIPALLWGVAWANIVKGVPLDAEGEYVGGFFGLLNPYALLGGVLTLTLFLAHGALFLQLRTQGVLHERAQGAARLLTAAALAVGATFALWTALRQGAGDGVEVVSVALLAAAVAALAVAAASALRRPAVAFGVSAAGIVLLFAGLWSELFPNALVSSGPGASLRLEDASSTPYTLKVMTVVAVCMVPVVLAYQAWSYWVFRRRVGGPEAVEGDSPLDLLGSREGPGEGGPRPAAAGG
ncbi:cytochrome d ubiquinol oxidase subunit II [Conexibacter sp. SYSU D00693]|uniref:cytochrome d ubiquinol oxidase subunit II n=1 Tax=Conexibacter sp. SYSU D00693 TaxID=2812560 RepID=UPI00196BA1BF|nr:cytochrome d ubiquinol oxidase subunit II [Conexibacter sp. SYSU D00693]